jgi:hypothetical protein
MGLLFEEDNFLVWKLNFQFRKRNGWVQTGTIAIHECDYFRARVLGNQSVSDEILQGSF